MADDAYTRTRRSLHAVAEHVLAAARHRATGRIGLVVSTGGFATPPFDRPTGETVIAVAGTDLVVRDDQGPRRRAITTIGDAAELAGIEPGAPADVYPPETPLDPAAPLHLDAAAAARLADALAAGQRALEVVVDDAARAGTDASITLWPEHLDVATTIDEVNLGLSPGDDHLDRPYAYVGPWSPRRGGFWNAPFGAVLPLDELGDDDELVAFLREGRQRAASDPLA